MEANSLQLKTPLHVLNYLKSTFPSQTGTDTFSEIGPLSDVTFCHVPILPIICFSLSLDNQVLVVQRLKVYL